VRISVLIPAYYSSETLADCLEALRRQDVTAEVEVIVVNSSPEAETRRIVARFPGVIFDQAPGRLLPHAARNRAAALAQGDLLVFTDPDCRARPGWLGHLLAAHAAGHGLVCGAIELGPTDDSWFARGVHLCTWPGHSARPGCTRAAPSAPRQIQRRRTAEACPAYPDSLMSCVRPRS
jgi:GT2 family glycosyltransferase